MPQRLPRSAARANLLTATDVGLRDHVHEAGILKAMGLTPRQVMATLVVSTTIVTAIGIVAGLAVAPRLINAEGQGSGMGWGIAAGLSPATVASPLVAPRRSRRRPSLPWVRSPLEVLNRLFRASGWFSGFRPVHP